MYAIRLIIDINMSLSNLIFIVGASAVPKVDLIFALISRINDRIKALKEKEDREPKREREIESSRSCVNDIRKRKAVGTLCIAQELTNCILALKDQERDPCWNY